MILSNKRITKVLIRQREDKFSSYKEMRYKQVEQTNCIIHYIALNYYNFIMNKSNFN